MLSCSIQEIIDSWLHVNSCFKPKVRAITPQNDINAKPWRTFKSVECVLQSTRGKWWLTHWASLLRWIWSISEYNLTTRDSPKWTPECLARADLIGWDPKGIPKWSSKIWSGIIHHKSDRKSCVLPTADRNNPYSLRSMDLNWDVKKYSYHIRH